MFLYRAPCRGRQWSFQSHAEHGVQQPKLECRNLSSKQLTKQPKILFLLTSIVRQNGRNATKSNSKRFNGSRNLSGSRSRNLFNGLCHETNIKKTSWLFPKFSTNLPWAFLSIPLQELSLTTWQSEKAHKEHREWNATRFLTKINYIGFFFSSPLPRPRSAATIHEEQ